MYCYFLAAPPIFFFTPVQYKRESIHPDFQHLSTPKLPDELHLPEKDICMFCGAPVKPFPSVENYSTKTAEQLYCCSDYSSFAEIYIQSCLEELLEEEAEKELQEKITEQEVRIKNSMSGLD